MNKFNIYQIHRINTTFILWNHLTHLPLPLPLSISELLNKNL